MSAVRLARNSNISLHKYVIPSYCFAFKVVLSANKNKIYLLFSCLQLLVSIALVAQYWFHERWMALIMFALLGPNCVVFSTFAFAILSQCVEDTKRAATSGKQVWAYLSYAVYLWCMINFLFLCPWIYRSPQYLCCIRSICFVRDMCHYCIVLATWLFGVVLCWRYVVVHR